MLRLGALAALLALLPRLLADSKGAEEIADEVCKNFVDNDGSFPYEEYKEGRVQDVWQKCYGAPALSGNCASCVVDGCCDFTQFDLDCSSDCRSAGLAAIHDRCWYRFDIDDSPAKPDQCKAGTQCEEPLYVYRKAVDQARRECLRPKWGYIFLLIFSAMAIAIVLLGVVGFTVKLTMDRVQRRKAE